MPLAKPVRAEGLVIGLLTAALAARGETVTCGVTIPTVPWTSTTVRHVQVASDGVTAITYPILWRTSIRVTCWAYATTAAQDLAALCEALLLSYAGSPSVAGFLPATSGLLTKDAATGAQLASFNVSAKLQGATFL